MSQINVMSFDDHEVEKGIGWYSYEDTSSGAATPPEESEDDPIHLTPNQVHKHDTTEELTERMAKAFAAYLLLASLILMRKNKGKRREAREKEEKICCGVGAHLN